MRVQVVRFFKNSPALVLLTYLLFVFLGAALIAPFAAWGLEYLADHVSFLQKELESIPFHRIVNQCLIFLALAGLWPMLKALQVASLERLGWKVPKKISRQLVFGFSFGLPVVLVALLINLGMGRAELANDFKSLQNTLSVVGGALLSAVVVAALEETLFRGALMTALRRAYGLKTAFLLSSAIYAITHFFAKPVNPQTIQLWSGFSILFQMFKGLVCWQNVIPGFLNLFMVGLLLATLFYRMGGLWASMAAHASWVFLLKTKGLFISHISGPYSWFFGTSNLIDGWLASILLLIFVFLAYKFLPVCRQEHLS